MCEWVTLEMAQDVLNRRGYLVINAYGSRTIGQVIDLIDCGLTDVPDCRPMKSVVVARTTCADFLEQWKLFGQDPAVWVDAEGVGYWRVMAE